MNNKLAVFFLISFTSLSSQAAFVDDGNYTTDTYSDLKWMDFSLTDGLGHEQALLDNPGWRLATDNEVRGLFNNFFSSFTPNEDGIHFNTYGEDAALDAEAKSFVSLFGTTANIESGGLGAAYGSYMDENGDIRMFGAWDYDVGSIYGTRVFGPDYNETNFDPGITGVALVSEVPVPSAAYFFISGIFALYITRKSKRRS